MTKPARTPYAQDSVVTALALQVRSLRKKNNLTLQRLGSLSGLGVGVLSRIENAEEPESKRSRVEVVSRLADALHTTVDHLLGRSDRLTIPETVAQDPLARQIIDAYQHLPLPVRKELRDFALFLQQQERKRHG